MDSPLDSPTRTLVAQSPTNSWSSGYSSSSTLFDEDSPREELLVTSIMIGDLAQVQSLVASGTFITDRHTWVLYYACLQGTDMIKALLTSPYIDFNFAMPELEGDAILHLVLRTSPERFRDRRDDIVKLLVQNGVNPLQCDRLGDTALHILAGYPSGSIELLRYLLGEPGTIPTDLVVENLQSACRAHINLQNNYGNTPLVVAILYNHVDCVGLLLSQGADTKICGEGGYSALDFAIERQYIEADTLIRRHMLKVESKG
jgi:hypothetical protein